VNVSCTYYVGDALTVMRTLPAGSVDMVATSPAYYEQREYLPTDHPKKSKELGHEPTPAEFLAESLRWVDECYRLLTDDGTIWINLGDTHAGSGGAGGDYNENGLREGQQRYDGTAARARALGAADPRKPRPRSRVTKDGWPLEQSVCWLPQLLGASMAYGRNLLTGEPCKQWVARPPVTWCKPSPMVGRLTRTFRSATELVIYAGKHQGHYFDLDSVRRPAPPENERKTWNQNGRKARAAAVAGRAASGHERYTKRTVNPAGAPPLNWWEVPEETVDPDYWVVSSRGYTGAHFATMPAALLERPIKAGCPEGGVVLDPFAGTGTTGLVATGHGRSAVLIDLDERNLHLARERIGMFLTEVMEASE
jgi:DNA modification methylase